MGALGLPQQSHLAGRDSLIAAPRQELARSAADVVAQLCAQGRGCITGMRHFPAVDASYADLPAWLDPRLRQALTKRGIARLWSHQAESLAATAAGQDVLLTTPTASGKSLCFHLPALQAALVERRKSLFLFPTKALAQDQVSELNALDREAQLGVGVYTFDGDTPGDARQAVRLKGDIVVSNPDMLHRAILPQHTKWAQFFESLAYVVIDELHVYRGVFGAHVANLMRRLARICAFYRVRPQFISASATLGNALEHGQALLGRGLTLVERSGAPQGDRTVMLWNPPEVQRTLGIRAPARSQSLAIARRAVEAGLKTLIFANSRLEVEVLTRYLKDRFDADPRRPERVRAYRGGHLPTTRRTTEQALRCGDVDVAVSTSAMELGVDIGALDVVVLNGYPGTLAQTWQRLGRAGRRQRAAIGVLVASSAALDQYVIRHPELVFDGAIEQARIEPNQLLVLLDQLRCAAFELPFAEGESFAGVAVSGLLDYLVEQQTLLLDDGRYYWIDESYPANAVNLRQVANGNFVVVDRSHGGADIIAEVDYSSAALTLYEEAIYLLQSRPYQVEQLDWEGRKAFVVATDADYYTDAIDYTRIRRLDCFASVPAGAGAVAHGEVEVLRRVVGYKKIRYYTHENIGYGQINLPDHVMHTCAVWWQCPGEVLDRHFRTRSAALTAVLGAAHAMHIAAQLRVMADARDLGLAVGDAEGNWACTADQRLAATGPAAVGGESLRTFEPAITLYDAVPGGMGLAQSLYKVAAQLVADAASLIRACDCVVGCPACIGPVFDAEHGQTAKSDALGLLALLGGPSC